MRVLLIVIAFLVIGMTNSNAQEVYNKKEARKEARRKKAKKKEKIAVVKTVPETEKVVEKPESTQQETTAETTEMTMFSGEVFGGTDESFTLTLQNDRVTIILSMGAIILKVDNKRMVEQNGVQTIVYDIVQSNLEGMNWKELTFLDISKMSEADRISNTGTNYTPRGYVINVTGSPELRFFGDNTVGKL